MVGFNDEEGYRRADGYKGALGKISGVGVVIVFAIMIAKPYVSQMGWLAWSSTKEGADQMLLADPIMGPQMRLIEKRFPDDYAKIRDAVRVQASTGDIVQVQKAFAAQMEAFYRRHTADFAQAPDANFRQLIEAHFQLAETLHWQRQTCARFFTGSMTADEVSLPAEKKLLNDFTMARLTAMADGRDHPAGRKTGPIDAATGAMLGDALRTSGAPFTTMEFFAGKRKMDGMTTEMRCETGWHLIRAIRGMPIEQGYPVYAVMYGG